jgi:WD40 repeat protein
MPGYCNPLNSHNNLSYKYSYCRFRRLAQLSTICSQFSKPSLTNPDGTARLWQAAAGKPVSSPMKHEGAVYSVAFSPDGKTIMAATDWWIHQSMVSGDTIKPKASRLLPGRWAAAYRFLDDQGDHMQAAVYVTGDSIKIINLHFDQPDAPPIQGDPEVLLKEWQEKLASRLNEETGKIEPLFQ